jgi:hypothetical protein
MSSESKQASNTTHQIHRLIHQAIDYKRLIRLRYGGKERIAEPHDYGVMARIPRLLCYQIGGESSSPLPNWRLLDVAKISELELLDRSFPGSRGSSYSKHLTWDQIFARVGPPE